MTHRRGGHCLVRIPDVLSIYQSGLFVLIVAPLKHAAMQPAGISDVSRITLVSEQWINKKIFGALGLWQRTKKQQRVLNWRQWDWNASQIA